MREAGKKDIRVYLIGNKCDLEGDISAETRRTGQDLAEKQAEHYEEVSAKTAHNIEDLFNRIIDDLLSSSGKKKEEAQAEGEKKEEQSVATENKTMKLTSAESKGAQGGSQWANCCQK